MKVHPAINKYTSILIKQEEIKPVHEISLGSDRGTNPNQARRNKINT